MERSYSCIGLGGVSVFDNCNCKIWQEAILIVGEILWGYEDKGSETMIDERTEDILNDSAFNAYF